MRSFVKIAAAAAGFTLVGCKEVQLQGPVAGAQVEISLLRSPCDTEQSLRSHSEAELVGEAGQAGWDAADDLSKLILLGNFEVEDKGIADRALYLVTASQGSEIRPEMAQESDVARPVHGSWHAIMTGEMLKSDGPRVSALTEAAYQCVSGDLETLTDLGVLVRLRNFARQNVADVNRDGRVDYLDVLNWSRYLSPPGMYRGDIRCVDALADGICRGATGEELASLAAGVDTHNLV